MTFNLKLFPILIFLLCFSFDISADDDCGRHDDLGLPSIPDVVICKDGFVVGFNTSHKVADWVMYSIDTQSVSPKLPRIDQFYKDPSVASSSQASKSSYYKSGYHRGHLAPNATMDYSRKSQKQSFMFTNIAPQLGSLNTQGWAELESQIRSCAFGSQSSLTVVTGPIWGSEVRWLEEGVRIPDGFFKVVVEMQTPFRMAAYLMPNAPVSKKEIEKYRVTVDRVETATGFDLYPILPWNYEEDSESGKNQFCYYQGHSVEEDDVSDTGLTINTLNDFLIPKVDSYSCEKMKTCSMMTSCEEAVFHLNTCRNSRLDSDKDSVPCEAICSD